MYCTFQSQYPTAATTVHSPTLSSPVDLLRSRPNLKGAIEAACKGMASFQIDGRHIGSTLIIGNGLIMAPLHLLCSSASQPLTGGALSHLLQRSKVCFTEIDPVRNRSSYPCYYNVLRVIEQSPEHDFCILQSDHDFCTHNPISYDIPSESVFAQMDDQGRLQLAVVQTALPPFGQEGFFAYSPTQLGSSGGAYFSSSGALIAQHIARSTGLCGFDTGHERKGLLAKDIARISTTFAKLQNVCLEPSHLPSFAVLYPAQNQGICYAEEKRAVSGTIYGLNCNCDYYELRPGTQRSVKLVLTDNIRRLTQTYEFSLRGVNGRHKLNVHDTGVYKGNEPDFYAAAANTFLRNYQEKNTTGSFQFDFKRWGFIAIL